MLNSSELFEFLPHMTHDEKTLTLAMPLGQKIFFVTVFFCSAVWGSLMKFFIYYNIMQEKFSVRPINILILIDQVIEHITKNDDLLLCSNQGESFNFAWLAVFITFLPFTFIFQIPTGLTLPSILKLFHWVSWNDRNVCIGWSTFLYFSMAYGTIGGLGIAVIRVLYIKVANFDLLVTLKF